MNTRNVTLAIIGLCVALEASARPMNFKAPNLEPPREGKPHPPVIVPEGGDKLISLDCPVTSSAGKGFTIYSLKTVMTGTKLTRKTRNCGRT